MSIEHPMQSNGKDEADEQDEQMSSTYQTKLQVHERDRYKCLCCGEVFDGKPSKLDADHIVPKGAGGSNLHTNIGSLCRKCHEAKHGEREIAPTIRFMSTGDMSDKEFRWFRHFWDEIFPALTQIAVNHRIEPLVDIDDSTPWQGRHIPMGFVRFCDRTFADRDDINYASREAHNYW